MILRILIKKQEAVVVSFKPTTIKKRLLRLSTSSIDWNRRSDSHIGSSINYDIGFSVVIDYSYTVINWKHYETTNTDSNATNKR